MVRGLKERTINADRKPKTRNQKTKIVIAVEGGKKENKTEKAYFRQFENPASNFNISFANGDDTDPCRLVKSLVNAIEKKGIDLKSGDRAFCIFDVDTNPQKNKQIMDAKKLAIENGIEIITSAPCFEFWFLLHCEYTASYFDNKQIIERLKKYYPNYEKTTNIYPKIKDNTSVAINRAKKLEKFQIGNNKKIGTVEANPNSEVYKVVELLNLNK